MNFVSSKKINLKKWSQYLDLNKVRDIICSAFCVKMVKEIEYASQKLFKYNVQFQKMSLPTL